MAQLVIIENCIVSTTAFTEILAVAGLLFYQVEGTQYLSLCTTFSLLTAWRSDRALLNASHCTVLLHLPLDFKLLITLLFVTL